MKVTGAPRVDHRVGRSSQATPATVDNSAPLQTRPSPLIYRRQTVQTNRATSLGSPATLHKRLVRLRQAELVAVEFIAGDRRSKLLVPTEKGLDYVSKFGSQLAQLSLAPVSQTD